MNDSIDDVQRLVALRRYQILDMPADDALDRITAIAARLFQVPIALITFVDSDRIWFKSRHGIDLEQIEREAGFCTSAILQGQVYVIPDALADPHTSHHSLVRGELGLRFYAAAPLITPDGYPLGTLCVIDRQPRSLTVAETQTLADLAALVMDQLELRLAARLSAVDQPDLRQINQSLEAEVARCNTQLAQRNAQLEASNYALHLSDRRFRNAFDYAGIGMALTNLEGKWLEVNRALCDITGYTEAELLATDFQSLTHPDDLASDLALMRQLIYQEIRHYHLEKRYRHRQGHWIWIMLSVSLVCDAQQVPLYAVVQIQDINERKQAEIALHKSQTMLLEAQALGRIGSWEYDVATQNITWSLEKFRILGRDPALGTPRFDDLLRTYHPEDGEQLRQAFTHTLATGEPYSLRLKCRCDDGTIRYLEDRGQAERNPHGEIVRVYGIVQDITERVEAERELQEVNTALALTIEGISRLDQAGRYLSVNQAYAAMVGYTPEELVGQPWQITVHPEDLELLNRAFEQMLAVGKVTVEARGVRKDGSIFHKQLFMVTALDDQHQPHGHYCFMKDISERARLEAERRQAEIALQASEERYRSVVSALSEGIAVIQADGTLLACNASAARILGLPSAQLVGRSVTELNGLIINENGAACPVDDYPPLVTLRTGRPMTNQILGLVKPRHILWISVNTQPLVQPGKTQPYAVVVSFTDVTELRRSEVEALRRRAEQERLLSDIAQRIRHTLDLEIILTTTVTEVQQFLRTDRVVIYRVDAEGEGTVIAEAVAAGHTSLLGRKIHATLASERLAFYLEGNLRAVADLTTEDDCNCPLDHLTQAKAKVVVPIVQHNRLWGMLLAYHSQGPRPWEAPELEVLTRLATQIAIAIQQSQLYQRLQVMNRQLEHLATHDGLTEVANRRSFDMHLQREWARLGREQTPLGLILCDIDHFKLYNDTYGHPAGDVCLQQVAQALQQVAKRPADLVARYGGEEFALVLPATDRSGAEAIARDIQHTLKQLALFHGASPLGQYITLSLGIASTVPNPARSPQVLIDQADAALYAAKQRGRDRYHFFQPG